MLPDQHHAAQTHCRLAKPHVTLFCHPSRRNKAGKIKKKPGPFQLHAILGSENHRACAESRPSIKACRGMTEGQSNAQAAVQCRISRHPASELSSSEDAITIKIISERCILTLFGGFSQGVIFMDKCVCAALLLHLAYGKTGRVTLLPDMHG